MYKLNTLQQRIIPALKDGLSTIIQTPPNSGKTLCYSLAAIEQKKTIILTPTKELSIQVYRTIRQLDSQIRVSRIGSIAFVAPIVEMISDQEAKKLASYGRERMKRMNDSIKKTVDWNLIDVCITTPLQLAQILKSGSMIQKANSLVIDEGDLLLGDIDFQESIETIKRHLNINQYIICSSVNDVPKSFDCKFTQFVSKNYMQMPQNIEFMNKPLEDYLHNEKTIIFVSGQDECIELQKELSNSVYFHSGQSVEDRVFLLESFRNNIFNTLITTGLGSRGLDFQDVTQIIIYDLPQNYDTFLLQCGRLRKENGKIIVRLKDSIESAVFSEFSKQKYVIPNNCIKL